MSKNEYCGFHLYTNEFHNFIWKWHAIEFHNFHIFFGLVLKNQDDGSLTPIAGPCGSDCNTSTRICTGVVLFMNYYSSFILQELLPPDESARGCVCVCVYRCGCVWQNIYVSLYLLTNLHRCVYVCACLWETEYTSVIIIYAHQFLTTADRCVCVRVYVWQNIRL